MNEQKESICKHCGQEFKQKQGSGYRRQSYCSDACRVSYWRQQDSLKRQAAHGLLDATICEHCGRGFRDAFGYGYRRKYCSDQ